MKRSTKHAFTLLEIILVIGILTMMATLVGTQMGKCIKMYAFQQEVETLYNTLKQAQVLAVTYKTDITLHFFKENGAYYFSQNTSEPFPEELFHREEKKLTEITKIKLGGKLIKKCDLTLYSHGSFEPRVQLHLCSKEQSTWLDFQGGFSFALSSEKPLPVDLAPAFPEEKLKKILSQKQHKPLSNEK